jgi:hypothetical protein
MGCHTSRPVDAVPSNRELCPVVLPSQLQNLFLIGYLGSEATDFVKTYCQDQIRCSDGFVHGEIPNLGTHVWAYQHHDYRSHQNEVSAWKLLRNKLQNESYMVALCFPYGERFFETSIENYVMQMYDLFQFQTLLCIMTGGTSSDTFRFQPHAFHSALLHFAGSVARGVKNWLPSVRCFFFISGVNVYNKLEGKHEYQAVLSSEASKLLKFIRTIEI